MFLRNLLYNFILFIIMVCMIIGCSDEYEKETSLNITLKLAPSVIQESEITRVTVNVSGADMDTLEFELKVDGRKATGIIAVPSGYDRHFIAKAYSGETLEFEGESFISHLEPGKNVPLEIQLKPATPSKQGEIFFENGNIWAVDNNPTAPTIFTINQSYMITKITTYHWNYARGKTPGTIALKDANGKIYGPWQAIGSEGQGGVKDAYWNVTPNIVLPPGTYTVIDSDPGTWAQNFESNGEGFVIIYGYPVESSGTKDEDMLLIPAGEFLMGSDSGENNEKPAHIVYLDAFYIDKYEVTNAQYKKFVQATGHKEPEGNIYVNGNWVWGKPWQDKNYNGDNQPVVCVSWNDAKAYADWAGKRLPTEAEWEKAARGGLVGKKYAWGDSLPPPNNYGNFADETAKRVFGWSGIISGYDDGYIYTSPVGKFTPNGYGLYDMAGNVLEWCLDWYDERYYLNSPGSNPKGPNSGTYKVTRGVCWYNYEDPTLIRIAIRLYEEPTFTSSFCGFRCAK